jgi:hypothetical protein
VEGFFIDGKFLDELEDFGDVWGCFVSMFYLFKEGWGDWLGVGTLGCCQADCCFGHDGRSRGCPGLWCVICAEVKFCGGLRREKFGGSFFDSERRGWRSDGGPT